MAIQSSHHKLFLHNPSSFENYYNDTIEWVSEYSFKWVDRLSLTSYDETLLKVSKVFGAILSAIITVPTALANRLLEVLGLV
jgi:hypothetical protein